MKQRSLKYLVVEWIPTEKNLLINDFYSSLGFKKFENKKSGMDIKNIKIQKYFIK